MFVEVIVTVGESKRAVRSVSFLTHIKSLHYLMFVPLKTFLFDADTH